MKKREEQPPPYLIEQVAGNSYSSWCPKRMPARSFVRFFLCLVMLMAFSVEKASAIGEVNWDNSWIEQRFDPEKATLIQRQYNVKSHATFKMTRKCA